MSVLSETVARLSRLTLQCENLAHALDNSKLTDFERGQYEGKKWVADMLQRQCARELCALLAETEQAEVEQ